MTGFLLIIFVEIFCTLSVTTGQRSNHVYVLFTDTYAKQIWKLDVTYSNYSRIVIKDHKNPVAIDYDPVQNKIYWSDVQRKEIRSCGIDGENMKLVRKLRKDAVPDGLALDPVSRLLFYTDTGQDIIAMMDLVNFHHRTVIDNDLDQPRGVALDRSQSLIFWTDWGEKPKIERSTYLGENRTTLVSTGLAWPNGLTLDTKARKMYWCDAKTDKIEMSGFDGSNRKEISSGKILHPFGIFFFEETLYVSDWESSAIYRIYLDGRNTTSWQKSNFKRPNGLTVFRTGAYQNDHNACTTDNGGCEQICVPYLNGRKCTCADGYTLATDGTNCTGNVFVIFTDSKAKQIWKRDLSTQMYSNIVIENHESPIAIDYDPVQNQIYWTDVSRADIRSCGINGEDLTVIRTFHKGAVPDGLALDPISRLIFYTDTGNDIIAMIDMVNHYQMTIISEKLDEPRAIALDKEGGNMYWTDWGEKPKIERSTYLGENRTTLVSTGLAWPNGVTLDTAGQRIYWCDAKTHRIEGMNFDGSNRTEIISGIIQHPFAIYLFKEILYVSDWASRRIYQVNINKMVTSWGGSDFQRPNGLTVFRAGAFQNVTNACSLDKGGCGHICVPTTGGKRCACADGFGLAEDGIKCIIKCNGSDGFSCNVHFDNSHIIYENGTVQTESGGVCIALNKCRDCNKGFYPAKGFCDICKKISHCNLEECTSASDEKCTRCNGVVKEQTGMRAYLVTSDKRQCRQACSWRHDSTRCYPGHCDGELADNCKCHPGFTGHHCETIVTTPDLAVKVELKVNNDIYFENHRSQAGTSSYWINVNKPSSFHYNLSSHYTAESSDALPVLPVFIEHFDVGIIKGNFYLKIWRESHLITNIQRSCQDVSVNNPRTDVNWNEILVPSDFPSNVFPFQNGDRVQILFQTSNGGNLQVRNMESRILETFVYNGQTVEQSLTLNVDLCLPYHCSVKSTCNYNMVDAVDVIKQTEDSRFYVKTNGWMDDESGVSLVKVEIIQLHYLSGMLRSGTVVHHETLKVDQNGHAAGFTLLSTGVYSILLSTYDKAGNKRKARRILMYDLFSTITVNEDHPIRVTSASASTNYTWQVDTKKITVDFTDRFVNKLQTTNNWLAAVADDTDIDMKYDDHEGERTVLEVTNKQGIIKFKTAYIINPNGEQLKREPKDDLFEDQGLKTVTEFTPQLGDGDLIILWVKAFDIKHNVETENVQVHIDSSLPVTDGIIFKEDTKEGKILQINVSDKESGIDRINWKIKDKATGASFASHTKHILPLGVTSCSQLNSPSEAENCYCTPQHFCYSKDYTLKLPDIRELKPTYLLIITVWNKAQNSITVQKKMIPSIETPENKMETGQENTYSWGPAFEHLQGIKYYKYGFGPRCYSLNEITSPSLDIKLTKTIETGVSWKAPSAGNYHLTVVAFDSQSQPIELQCSGVILVGDGSNDKTSTLPVYIGAAVGTVVVIIIIIVVVVIVKRRSKKLDSDYEHLNHNQRIPEARRHNVFNIAYGLDDDSANHPETMSVPNSVDDENGPYTKLRLSGIQHPDSLYDVVCSNELSENSNKRNSEI